ncbi:MAG: hypothetical protein KJ964_04685 [Verrucomicrobia bacterium]|nr:hypothetical protein [Verrucomicrobiota bacterium]MBU1733707.1 hypothetical protein [Verrucomicrobiota bacterium]MBU1858048.1 hypothetical protein [Verrucomicrobiota bacterium]
MVTFRGLAERIMPELDSILDRYPVTVQRQARERLCTREVHLPSRTALVLQKQG